MEGFVWIYVMMQQTWWWSSYTHSLPISFGTKIWELLTNHKETKKQQKQQQRRIEMHQIEKWENDACWNSKTQNQQHQPKWACLFSLLFSTYVYFIRPTFWIDQFLVLWFSFLVVALSFRVLRATFLYKKKERWVCVFLFSFCSGKLSHLKITKFVDGVWCMLWLWPIHLTAKRHTL